MAKKLIMVMGVQRSGTKVLFNSLASDKRLTSFNESVDNAIYDRYRLRPLPQIAHVLTAAPGTVLLKPISETSDRTLGEIAAEYEAYDLRVVWIYRDPVNVLYSMQRKDGCRRPKSTPQFKSWTGRDAIVWPCAFTRRIPPGSPSSVMKTAAAIRASSGTWAHGLA